MSGQEEGLRARKNSGLELLNIAKSLGPDAPDWAERMLVALYEIIHSGDSSMLLAKLEKLQEEVIKLKAELDDLKAWKVEVEKADKLSVRGGARSLLTLVLTGLVSGLVGTIVAGVVIFWKS